MLSKLTKKRVNNVIIGFDAEIGEIRVMRFFGTDLSTVTVDIIPCKRKAGEATFFAALANRLATYFSEKPLEPGSSVKVVLPDRMVAMDQISLPVMNKKLMKAAMQAEYESIYRNHKDLLMNSILYSQNKRFMQFNIVLLRRDVLSELYKALALGKAVDNVTFSASSASNAVLSLRPKVRHNDFFFADVRENKTVLTIMSKGRAVGYASIPYGYRMISSGRVQYEALIADHDIGELAVIQAKEKAKHQAAIHATDNSSQPQNEQIDLLDDDLAMRKGQKKLPKFLQRPAPETREGVAVENFRIILKWLLLYARQNKHAGNLPTPEFIMVNLPGEFNYVIEAFNAPEEKAEHGIELRPFNTDAELGSDVCYNLDLFGAAFSQDYNKHNNF